MPPAARLFASDRCRSAPPWKSAWYPCSAVGFAVQFRLRTRETHLVSGPPRGCRCDLSRQHTTIEVVVEIDPGVEAAPEPVSPVRESLAQDLPEGEESGFCPCTRLALKRTAAVAPTSAIFRRLFIVIRPNFPWPECSIPLSGISKTHPRGLVVASNNCRATGTVKRRIRTWPTASVEPELL